MDGLLINALDRRINFPTFSVEIAAPKFLLESIGSIMIIVESNFYLGFPIALSFFSFAISLSTFVKLPK